MTTSERPASDAWKLVPVEPDDAMIETGQDALEEKNSWGGRAYASDVWKAMLASAPASPAIGVQAVKDEMVERLVDFICDDVLPSYGISNEVGRNDVELPAAVRAALSALHPAPEAASAGAADAQGNVAVEPVAWRYRYTDPTSGKPVWRDRGGPWNGQSGPSETQALVPASSIASLSERLAEVENDRDRFIEGKVLAEHQRDELRAKLAEAREVIKPFANLLPDSVAPSDRLQEKLQEWCRRARAFRDATSAAPMSQER